MASRQGDCPEDNTRTFSSDKWPLAATCTDRTAKNKSVEANCGNRWTSTENSSNNAWNLNNGSWNNNNKTNTNNSVLPAYELSEKENKEYVTFDEITEAWLDCRKHKQKTESCITFEMELWSNLYQLKEDLNNGTYEIGYSIAFVVTRPKLREVFAADFRDRIVHHLLYRRFRDIFENYMTADSYACREGKGVQYAVRELSKRVITHQDSWIWQGDIHADFMTIDKTVLWQRLEKIARWKYTGDNIEFWLNLWKKIIYHRPQERCILKGRTDLWQKLEPSKSLFYCPENTGLAIGNLSSQHLNNLLLTDLDYFISGFVDVQAYGRYADDFYTIADQDTLKRIMPQAREYARNVLHMEIHQQKWRLDKVGKGVKFVGYVCKGDRIYAGGRLVNHAFEAATQETNLERMATRINSYFGFLRWCDTYAIRRNIAKEIWKRAEGRVNFTNNFRKINITKTKTQ